MPKHLAGKIANDGNLATDAAPSSSMSAEGRRAPAPRGGASTRSPKPTTIGSSCPTPPTPAPRASARSAERAEPCCNSLREAPAFGRPAVISRARFRPSADRQSYLARGSGLRPTARALTRSRRSLGRAHGITESHEPWRSAGARPRFSPRAVRDDIQAGRRMSKREAHLSGLRGGAVGNSKTWLPRRSRYQRFQRRCCGCRRSWPIPTLRSPTP